MAETKRMTAEQVVSYLLEEEGFDFLRESLTWVVQQLMEAEVSELVGAAHGERGPRGAAHAPQRLPRPDLGDARRRARASARLCRAGGVYGRRLDAQGRPGGRVARAADLESEASRTCAGLDEQVDAFRNRPLEGSYPYLWLDAKVEKV